MSSSWTAPDLPVLAVRCYPTGNLQVPDISGGNGPSPHPPIQQVPDVLNGIEIRALRWPWQNTDIPVLQEFTHRTSSMAGGIVMLEGHVRMSLQEGYHMKEEDVFPVMHSVEIAYNDNELCFDTPPQTMTDPPPPNLSCSRVQASVQCSFLRQ